MGLLDLIMENKGSEKPKKESKETVSFPKSNSNVFEAAKPKVKKSHPNPVVFGNTGGDLTPLESCEPHINNVMSLYEKGFDDLNQDGYDFYEYYKAVLEAGADNPAIYKMALTMAKAMDTSVSKEKLLSQSDFYLKEINKVYQNYVTQGKSKKASLETQKEGEEKSLQSELNSVIVQMQQLEQKQNSLKAQIGTIDSKYATQLHDIRCKLEANDTAKREIFESINKVKSGINSNL